MNKPTPKKPEDSAGGSGARRHRLPAEPACPALSQVKTLLEEAEAKRGFLIELPWMSTDGKNFILTVQWDSNLKDPVWTLYEETEAGSKVVWTQPFAAQDLEFMYDILSMSAGSTGGAGIPDELKMQPAVFEDIKAKEKEEPAANFDSYGAPSLTPFAAPPAGGSPFAAPQQGFGGGFAAPAGGSFTNLPSLQPTGYPQQPPQAPPQQQQQHNYPPQQQQQQGYPQQQQGYPPQQQQGYPQQQQPGYPPQQTPYPGYPPQQAPPGYNQNPYQQQQPQQMPYGQQGGGYNNMPGAMAPAPSYAPEMNEPKIRVDYHLIDKGANILLGSLLQEAGLISAPTLEAALKLQEMVRDEKMTPDKAPEVLKRLHAMGSSIDQYLTKGDLDRTSAAAKAKSAPQAAKPQASGAPAAPAKPAGRDLKGAFDLLQKAQLLTENDLVTADNVRKKHGGDLIKILEAAGKCNGKTVDAACTSLPLIREGLMKIEQVIMALNYCERMRVSFDEALDEMGWQNPRKIRTDLPL